MWHITAPESIDCHWCNHPIDQGEPCISDLPEALPKGVVRNHYRHFHLAGPQCESRTDAGSCYQAVAALLVTEKAPQEMLCLNCGDTIDKGAPFLQDFFYVRANGMGSAPYEESNGPAALISALAKGGKAQPTRLEQFSPWTFQKFRAGGLGRGRGVRTPAGAQEFFRTSVPRPVRNLGEGAVRKFINGKQASHIESVANAPGKALDPRNVIWESGKANLARGSRNMTRMEVVSSRAANAVDSAKIVGTAAARNATKGAGWAALFELPVSLVENSINIYRGKKSRKDALKDTGKDVAIAGAAGGVVTFGITAAGLGPAVIAAGPVLVPVGVGIFTLTAGSRIFRAWKDGLSLVELNFHAGCPNSEDSPGCYPSFAQWVSSYPTTGPAETQEHSE